MKKKVLVTGASGFIGNFTIPYLVKEGYSVHAVSQSPWRQEKIDQVIYHNANFLDSNERQKLIEKVSPSHLLHLAWFVKPGEYLSSPLNFQWVQASLDLFENFVKLSGQRIVCSGTCFEYDLNYGECTENRTPIKPNSTYGLCKSSLQKELESFAKASGISQAWGRIFYLYGPKEPLGRLVSSVINSLLEGKPARCSHGNQIRDYLYVEEVALGLVKLLDSNVQGPINIASGKGVALKEIIYGVADILNKRELVQLGALPAAASEPPVIVADIKRLKNEVGYQPELSLIKGLTKTIEWWKKQLVTV